jgi:hypothetical protein
MQAQETCTMTNEKDSSSPIANSQDKSPLQSTVNSPAPQVVLPDKGKEKTSEYENKTNELAREFRIAEKWVIGTNIVLAVIGIGALYIYNGQLRVMRGQLGEIIRQYPELQKSADAAKTSADIAKNSFEMEKRRAEDSEEATCRPTGDIAVGATVYRFFMPNSGKVSARNLHGHIELSLNSLPGNKRSRLLAGFDVSQDELAGEKGFEKRVSIDIAHDWEKLINTKETIVATGEIQYDNGFDRMRYSSMCYAMLWVPSPTDPNNRAHGFGVDCDRLPEFLATLAKSKTN